MAVFISQYNLWLVTSFFSDGDCIGKIYQCFFNNGREQTVWYTAKELGMFNPGWAGKVQVRIYNGHPLKHLVSGFFAQSHFIFQDICPFYYLFLLLGKNWSESKAREFDPRCLESFHSTRENILQCLPPGLCCYKIQTSPGQHDMGDVFLWWQN